MRRPFHLAFPVTDLDSTKRFYHDVLGCTVGRESPGKWVDFDLFGHQMSAHLRPQSFALNAGSGAVDGDAVPIPHFGVVLTMEQWHALAERLKQFPEVSWILKPKVRFQGEPGEQGTFFISDPSGNALEFKGFQSDEQIFAV
ncbi:VOC family protein [Pseudovibrio sp. SPO723]|uniref:VOC family protein n=1 Tax=Nesiotobacter zosterae TaxID=392721 RepID=UPI0029C5C560|nr:VOC family protein [Pseudovibrio sp. SPO723]MDX5592366.1 VOC family protein [Pseudovibrio sp. SPO723]